MAASFWFGVLSGTLAASKLCSWDNATANGETVGMKYTRDPWAFVIDKDCTALTVSELYGITLGVNGVRALADSLMDVPELASLDVQGNRIGDTGARALAEALQSTPRLSWLSLASNDIGTVGAQALAASLQHLPKLSGLDISFNPLGQDGSKALARAIASTEASRGGTYFEDVIGIDEHSLMLAREASLPKHVAAIHTELECEAPPCTNTHSIASFAGRIERWCSSILAVAGAKRFLDLALGILGVEDMAALQVLEISEIDTGLRDGGIPVAPRKQLCKCFSRLLTGPPSEL